MLGQRGSAAPGKIGLDPAVLERAADGGFDEAGQRFAGLERGFQIGAQLGIDADLGDGGGLHRGSVVRLHYRLEGWRDGGAGSTLPPPRMPHPGMLAAMARRNPYHDPSRPHHHPEGFRNSNGADPTRSLAEVLRWRWDAARHGLPRPPATPIPAVAPDLGFLRENARAGASMQPAVTWVGHATVLAQLGGLNVLTDPIFAERASPLSFAGPKRHQPPGLGLGQLPRVDLVLVSHNHYDHLDEASVRALNAQAGGPPLFVVPLGLAAWLRAKGVPAARSVELDWWQTLDVPGPVGGVELMLVPAQHWSARGLGDRMATLWGGFALFAPDAHLFYAGDTGYSRDFAEIRERCAQRQAPEAGGGFDIALLPIGAYEPRWFMATQHVNVEEAVKIHLDLGAKRSLGVHWGTFQLTDEPLDEPPRRLVEERARLGLADHAFFTLAIGQTERLERRGLTG